MSQANSPPTTPEVGSQRKAPPSLNLLIEVPAVKIKPNVNTRRAWGGTARSRRIALRGRSRRRLRREVRLAGCALLFMAPVVSACTMGWSSRANRFVACAVAADQRLLGPDAGRATTTASPGVFVRSTEPAIAAPAAEAGVPVIFPGYVLPDDTFEDTAHAGS
jgi:hypothetical protein